ncbi:hypothetical protein [Bosea sp. TAF32]|uniref:hypothetical protein n=1 Tax=Bosea sp. TAF32 TaxID=3237482 RepID=UPI003F916668
MRLNLENAVWIEGSKDALGYRSSERVLLHDGTEWIAEAHWVDMEDGLPPRVFFHLEVFYLSASIMRDMLKQWRVFREEYTGPLFTMADADTPALDRLREKFGFQVLRHSNDVPRRVRGTDGRWHKIYVHVV